ncbi:MAG TPA: extracellular solute-binding protein [Arachnia sp.]|nr:extracellular solute-binding protein [Arachnia sp.]
MTNRIKVLKAAALAAAAAVALAGCGGGGGGGTSNAEGKKVMNAMFIGGTADKALIDVVREVTDEFNESNEFNVEMRIETYENEQYKTKLASLMASNSQPDVFFTWSSGYLKPFVAGNKVLDLTPFLDADAEWKGRFNDGVFGPVTFDDKIYAVPHGAAVAVMYYNAKVFADQGLEVPTTYAEFVDVVTKLKAAGITPLSAPVKDAWIAGQLLQQIGNAEAGIALFDETVALTAKWNDPRYVTAGEKLKEPQTLGAFPDGYLGMSNDEGRDLFTSGKAAMYYMGSWDMSVLSDSAVAGDIDVFNIPPVNPGENAVGDVDLAYAVGANTKNADAAAAYIKLFSDTTAQEGFAYDASYLISTNTELDEAKLSPLFIKINALQHDLSGVTPWFDRVFGAGEGVEFNNAAQAIIAGQDPAPRLDELQTFAEANAER